MKFGTIFSKVARAMIRSHTDDPSLAYRRQSMPLEPGDAAPAFSLDSTEGKKVSLNDFKGKKVILYFYPKDDTPGCTKEACDFRDSFAGFKKQNAVILGISPDDLASHESFREKFSLPFPLLADPDHAVAEKYGVWKEKLNFGKTYMGIERTTFLIDEQGKIALIFPRVKVDGHSEKLLEALGSQA
jgi:peroxiredoxin Q/BCP